MRFMRLSGLGFKLKTFQHAVEGEPSGVPRVIYMPTTLAMEQDQEFIQQLDFLTESFSFARDQLYVFLKTLNDRVSGTVEISDSEGAGGDGEAE